MFTDKIAIVTGAGRGIGKEIAKTLAAKGALVIVNYCGSAKRAEETVQEIEAAGGKAEALQSDISDFTKAGEMMDYVIQDLRSGRHFGEQCRNHQGRSSDEDVRGRF